MKNGPKNSEYVQYPKETSLVPKMISRHKDKYHKNVALKLIILCLIPKHTSQI